VLLRLLCPVLGICVSFTLHLDTNYIDVVSKEPEKLVATPEEEKRILDLSKDPEIHSKILQIACAFNLW
jgi:DNA replicative helicase MCM subunit Mcm2 (Cdc46/Mcm family)